MKVTKKTAKRARIEIIPMIDVIFFLLVFFMVSSLAMTKINSLPVALPKTSAQPEALKQDVILTVRKDGSIYINKNAVTLDSLGAQLAYEMKNDPQEPVLVNADEAASYGTVVRIMDRAKQIGVRRFALATSTDGGR
jgi:biopolymer transport protein ExbD